MRRSTVLSTPWLKLTGQILNVVWAEFLTFSVHWHSILASSAKYLVLLTKVCSWSMVLRAELSPQKFHCSHFTLIEDTDNATEVTEECLSDTFNSTTHRPATRNGVNLGWVRFAFCFVEFQK
jgi:hypothetical protein